MPQAIPYIRFSSARQSAGSSEERQRQMVNKWLIAHPEFTPSKLTYEDLGRSGFHGHHIKEGGNFAKLLAAIEAGLIQAGDCVLVEAVDRTGRLPAFEMIADVLKPILYAGVNIITLDDQIEYTKDSVNNGHLHLLAAKIQAAHGYSKQLSERTKASYEMRREQANLSGKVKRHTPIWLTSDGEVIERIAKHVRHAFELYVSGVGKNAIANRLRATDVPELARCSGPTVEGWLRNYAAIGSWEYGKKDLRIKVKDADKAVQIIPNVYPPIVSDALFMLAQQRKRTVATKPPSRTSKHLLVGLVKCGECGSNYVIHNKDGKPNNMRCGLHHRLGAAGCINNQTMPYQVLMYVYSLTAIHHLQAALSTIQLSVNDKRKLELTIERDKLTASIQKASMLLMLAASTELEHEYTKAVEARKEIEVELEILDRAPKVVGKPNSVNSIFELSMIEDQMVIDDPLQLSSLYQQAGYSINVKQKVMNVGEQLFTYHGVRRKPKSTVTLGYRVAYNGKEELVSPELKAITRQPVGNVSLNEKINYLHGRGNPVSPIKAVDYEYD